jgi:phosphatidylserine/phosphatidylglycerophosphate/cardiolipin synthase-like enzyme
MRPALLLAALAGCNPPPDAADLEGTRGSRVDFFFNDPGSRLENLWNPDVVDIMVDLIQQAGATIDFAVMGFSHPRVIDAMVAAHDRGVIVRMVGDAGHLTNAGYERFRERHIPMTVGNGQHIMHDKFMVIDGRFVFAGTSNWSGSDLENNSNNFFLVDSPPVAADFTAEFLQMFDGVFGNNKVEIDNGRLYQLGDTEVEVWFSPNEDAMGRIIELVKGATDSVRFTIFAFTKDQVGSALIEKQAEFDAANLADGIADLPFDQRRSVAGVIDQSQLHSNGQYHEVYRLLGAGIPVRMDAIDSTLLPGDYQAGGGRLHSKTMVIDAGTDHPTIISGSFNWSASATQSNDEFLLVFRGERAAETYAAYFDDLYGVARDLGGDRLGADLQPGDLRINEVMWYGVTDADPDGFDEFIEIENRTDRDINLDLWQIANPDDVVVGFPPGSRVPAGGTFLIVDHVLEPYVDGQPQDSNTAYLTGDLVLNAFNDNRQARLYLKDGALELFLKDPDAQIADVAGDGGPAFAGGPDGAVVRSMERLAGDNAGDQSTAWKSCTATEGNATVNPDYRATILATPGGPNSP